MKQTKPNIKSPKPTKKAKQPIPKIIKPVIPPMGSRRMIDSALSSRSATSSHEPEPSVQIENLPVADLNSLSKIEQDLFEEPATSRSSSLLNHLPELDINPDKALDEIFTIVKQWNPDSILNVDFRVYHLLTNKLFDLIKGFYEKDSKSETFFKTLAICIHLVPISDRDSLNVVIQCLYHFSREQSFDYLFIDYSILTQLIEHTFSEFEPICTICASILRHICQTRDIAIELNNHNIIQNLGRELRTTIRRNRFSSERSVYYYQLIGILNGIIPVIPDFSLLSRYNLPVSILELTIIYQTDPHIQSIASKSLSLMLTNQSCIENLEMEELQPFFPLLQSGRSKTRYYTAMALSNAMQQSDIITQTIVEIPAPLGVFSLCCSLQNSWPNSQNSEDNDRQTIKFENELPDEIKDIMLALLRCLAKATEIEEGAKAALFYLDIFIPFLDFPLSDVETWTRDEMIVANTLICLKNFAEIDPKKVSFAVKGKLMQLMYFGVVDYVVDMMKKLMKCEEGKKVCDEVINVEEVALLLQASSLPKNS